MIEVFSRKVFCRALKNKSGAAVLAALQDIVQRDFHLPYRLEGSTLVTDRGTEFTQANLKNFLHSHGVFHSFSYARHKAR